MKKYMIADLIKDAGSKASKETEDIDSSDVDPNGNEFNASIGVVTYQPNGDGSYEVDIDFGLGGSATYTMDTDQLQEWINNPTGGYYNANVRGNWSPNSYIPPNFIPSLIALYDLLEPYSSEIYQSKYY